ncbi:MAG: glycosyltransferase family 2 protein [Planctomycetota bacterium]
MDCTALLVNWNGRHLLPEALEALPRNLPVIVADNGSTDGSVEWLEARSPAIRLLKFGQNLGFAKANNLALGSVTTRRVLLINTDARPAPGALESALDYMEAHPGVAMVGARLLHEDGRDQNSVTPRVDLWSECLNRNLVSWWRGERRKGLDAPVPVDAVVGAAMLCDTAALRSVGGFDEDYFFFFEETDLCWRLRKTGHGVMHLPLFRVTHLGGGSASRVRFESRAEFHRSRELFFLKHHGTSAAKTLHRWQWRRLKATRLAQRLGRLLSAGLWISKRHQLIKELDQWYALGCPSDVGLPRGARMAS